MKHDSLHLLVLLVVSQIRTEKVSTDQLLVVLHCQTCPGVQFPVLISTLRSRFQVLPAHPFFCFLLVAGLDRLNRNHHEISTISYKLSGSDIYGCMLETICGRNIKRQRATQQLALAEKRLKSRLSYFHSYFLTSF